MVKARGPMYLDNVLMIFRVVFIGLRGSYVRLLINQMLINPLDGTQWVINKSQMDLLIP